MLRFEQLKCGEQKQLGVPIVTREEDEHLTSFESAVFLTSLINERKAIILGRSPIEK
jgi:hypothetical protein